MGCSRYLLLVILIQSSSLHFWAAGRDEKLFCVLYQMSLQFSYKSRLRTYVFPTCRARDWEVPFPFECDWFCCVQDMLYSVLFIDLSWLDTLFLIDWCRLAVNVICWMRCIGLLLVNHLSRSSSVASVTQLTVPNVHWQNTSRANIWQLVCTTVKFAVKISSGPNNWRDIANVSMSMFNKLTNFRTPWLMFWLEILYWPSRWHFTYISFHELNILRSRDP